MTIENALCPALLDKRRGLRPEGFRYLEDVIGEAGEAARRNLLPRLT